MKGVAVNANEISNVDSGMFIYPIVLATSFIASEMTSGPCACRGRCVQRGHDERIAGGQLEGQLGMVCARKPMRRHGML
jgi:hypothetical protein